MKLMKKSRKIIYPEMIVFLCIVICFFVASLDYWKYAMIAKSTVPIMDYWQWIATYGQKVFDGTVTFADYFNSDLGEHIQPVAMAINFGMLKLTDFNVAPMVEWGIALRIVVAAFVLLYFLWRQRTYEKQNYILLLICSVGIFMSMLNYNQWELTIEPFSIGNIFRVACYLISFFQVEAFVGSMESRSAKRNIANAVLLGCCCALQTLLVGGAYFVGHLIAIGLAMLYVLWQRRVVYKVYFWPMAVWAVISFVSACIYYYLLSQRGSSSAGEPFSLNDIVFLAQAVCFFWGGLFVHNQSMEQYGNSLCMLIGAATLIYSIYILIRYMKKDNLKNNLFPVICVLYALVLSVAISFGRLGKFDASYLSASRYTVESSIGLLGIVWMSYRVCAESAVKSAKVGHGLCVCIALVMLFFAAKVEKNMAPHRKIYNDSLAEMMTHLEDYSDDELAVFQANSPEYVRYSVEFFKENNLSIFSEPNS